MVIPVRHYDAPCGRVGRRFVHDLATELTGFQQCRWNSEKLIFFQTVILQRGQHVTSSSTIMRRIDRRLDAWEAGEFAMMAENTTRTCTQYLSTRKGEDTQEHRSNILHSLVLQGKLRSDFRWITDKNKGRVFQSGDICPKTGKPVLEVL